MIRDHFERHCQNKDKQQSKEGCSRCGRQGHSASSCPMNNPGKPKR